MTAQHDAEGRAWRIIHQPAPRGKYEHSRAWSLRNSRRQNFLSRLRRQPTGCWLWTGISRPGPKGLVYPMFHWSQDGVKHSKSAFYWLMTEWFPDVDRPNDRAATVATCGNSRCITPKTSSVIASIANGTPIAR